MCGGVVCSLLPVSMPVSCDHNLRSIVDSCGAEIGQQRCGLCRQNTYALDAVKQSIATCIQFGKHSAGDDIALFQIGDLSKSEPAHNIAICALYTGYIGHEDKCVSLCGDSARGGHLIGVDVVVFTVEAQRDGRDDRHCTHCPDCFKPTRISRSDLSDKAK